MGILCRVTAFLKDEFGGKTNQTSQQIGAMAIVEISSNDGENKNLVISRSQDIMLEIGDRIKCLSGKASVEINHATQPVTHIISETSLIPFRGSQLKSIVGSISKIANEIEITDGESVTLMKGGNVERVTNDMARANKSMAAAMSKIGGSIKR
jgi:hypothetical protein